MNINELIPVEYANQRVLTTAQIADAYGTTSNVIKENFRYAKAQFKEGEHYFKLSGTELKALKSKVGSSDPALIGKFASSLYLWTQAGALLHCKMLSTDKASEVFAELEKNYFNPPQVEVAPVVEEPKKPTPDDLKIIDGVHCYLDKNNLVWLILLSVSAS